ncbi:CD151 antigen [Galendromus occidentalis]|uniref:Tetraspanin n=1 Tax=Galendromus occidentalis TaxID=34638 RepID=A0AAJ7L6P7_9ACAR|nr:CD151 antigen [Galendromus occidentalis]
MVQGCGAVVKYALFVANLIIMLGGVVVFGVGVWTLADRSFMERLLGSNLYVSSAAIMICTGLVTTFVAFLGCFGAWKELRCLLMAFFAILLVLFVVMMVGGILGYVFRNEVDDRMYAEMISSIPKYKNDSAVTRTWDSVQQAFRCCGMQVRGPTPSTDPPMRIWFQNPNFNLFVQVPDSCCMRKEWLGGCRERPTERDTYMDNCYTKMRDFMKSHAEVIGGLGIGIACVLLIGMILSCILIVIIF